MSLINETQESTSEAKSSLIEYVPSQTNYEDLSVGAFIRQARLNKGLSQKDLASLSGITSVQLCRIEKNECIPSKKSLQLLSAHIGIDYTTLIVQAGYNNMAGKRIFYKKDGHELDTNRLINSIYKADSDLLDYFYDFETFGTVENVTVLKLILQAMRKEENICNTITETDTLINSYFKKTFQALKKFIISSLSSIVG